MSWRSAALTGLAGWTGLMSPVPSACADAAREPATATPPAQAKKATAADLTPFAIKVLDTWDHDIYSALDTMVGYDTQVSWGEHAGGPNYKAALDLVDHPGKGPGMKRPIQDAVARKSESDLLNTFCIIGSHYGIALAVLRDCIHGAQYRYGHIDRQVHPEVQWGFVHGDDESAGVQSEVYHNSRFELYLNPGTNMGIAF